MSDQMGHWGVGGWLVWWLAWPSQADGLGKSGQQDVCVTAELMMAKG